MKIVKQFKSLSVAVIFTASLIGASKVGAAVVTQWNFNGTSAATIPGGPTSPTASTGTGTASLVGGVTGDPAFGSGESNGGSSDPTIGNPPDFGWQTLTFAAQGQQSGLRGVQFNVTTVGFDNIIINWDQRHSNTSSRFAQLQYSLDGTNFTSAGLLGNGIFEALTGGDTWYNNRTVNLSSIAGAADNANFAFRIVSVFDPANGTAYAASTTTSTYAASGTWRFDMVTVNGSVLPAPGALALLGLAGCAASARRRRRN